MTDGPFKAELMRAVEAAYDVFGRGHVSGQLDVCLCPVCMTEEARAAIIATRNDRLSVAQICDYSNSAHGVPRDLDDLKLILPRYLEIMAADELADDIGVGTELLRFGDAVRAYPELFTAQERAVLDEWARAIIRHFAWTDMTEEGAIYTPPALLETLLCGGWPPDVLTGALEDIVADPELGQNSLSALAGAVMGRARRKDGRLAPGWFALRYCGKPERLHLIAWLNAVAASNRVLDLATQGAEAALWVQSFASAAGQFDAALLPSRD
ncbi:hypothetical protein [Roseovarius sp. THAF9]|uniref:hypothetical protein n=1 Tax=Roseovarius sp. THAF9 TaxID=2587847 RepID=UPI0012690D29|nr:hypothetical protein [Roseovarius sp. THAF9]